MVLLLLRQEASSPVPMLGMQVAALMMGEISVALFVCHVAGKVRYFALPPAGWKMWQEKSGGAFALT